MRRIVRHDVVDSTNERAFASLAEGGALDGDVHVARGQELGRGRLGRRWVSRPGEGLYLSRIHLPPPDQAPPAPALTMAAGVALLDTLRAAGLRAARLSWPNDVVIGALEEGPGSKLAGILVESRSLDPERPRYVIGIGVNVQQKDFPADLLAERAVTSLALEGLDASPDDLVEPLARALDERLVQARRDPETLAADFLDATQLGGRRVEVRTAEGPHRGRLLSIDLRLGLALEEPAGSAFIELAHVHAVEPAPL